VSLATGWVPLFFHHSPFTVYRFQLLKIWFILIGSLEKRKRGIINKQLRTI